MTDTTSLVSAKSREEILKELEKLKEIGGTEGLEPTRYGDWEHKGRLTDF